MALERGLGRGLGALLGDAALQSQEGGSLSLPISQVEPGLKQPRKRFDEESLQDLADSIRIHGIIQPLTVRRLSSGYYQIIAGERRWRAAKLAGLSEIPAVIIEAIDRWGWYNRNAAINPYLSEGKKTVTLEILEQLGWRVPDSIALSVGDGCTIAGAWKGLKDLYAAGFIDRLPRLISVQAEGCCPLNRAIETGKPWEPMAENTLADSIAVGVPRNPDKALCAMRESDGVAVNVSDGEILEAMRLLGRTQGVFGEPAGAAGTAGVKKAVELGLIPAGSTVVSIVTGNGLKDVQSGIQAAGEPMRVSPDMDALLAAFAAQDIRP